MTFKDRLTRPCAQRWAELLPRGEGRYCGQCDTTVIDLSRLTKRQALEKTKGGACVRARLDERGEPLFRPDPERRLGRRTLAVVAALAGGCASSAPIEPRAEQEPALSAGEPLPLGVALEELEPAELAALTDAAVSAESDAGPTPEQLELTRQKRARRALAAQPIPSFPQHHEYLGGAMPSVDF